MNFFIDTNVPIGYSVIHDKWHDSSKKFINDNKNHLFWSNLVKMEYDNKLDDIIDLTDEFLKSTLSLLNNNEKDFYNYFDFEKFVLTNTNFCKLDLFKKQKILEQFWQNNNFIHGISRNIYSCFINFANDFELIYIQRDVELNKLIKLHNCGLENFRDYYEYSLRLYNYGIHPPDCKIIVDAHDCGIKNGDLIFVSNDKEMLEKIINKDYSYLNIIEFKSCTN